MSAVIEIKNLKKSYKYGEPVLKGIDLTVDEHEFIAIMGRSGCGKTTLLKILGLMDNKITGSFVFKGDDINDLYEEEIADIRRREMGFVFQDYNLLKSLTVGENVRLPAILDKMSTAKGRKKAAELAARFKIDELMDKYPYQLSGGEQQRVSLCRALINDPDLILGDEPTGNLDSVMGKEVIETLVSFNRDLDKTVIIVTHDPKIACRCKKVIFMKDGLLFETLEKDRTADDPEEKLYEQIVEHSERMMG